MKSRSGFTLVELLIVIVVIAILAAISIVAYNGVQQRAHRSSVQTNLSNISRQLELYRAEHGYYPYVATQMPRISISKGSIDATQNNLYYCLNRVNQQYAFGIRVRGGSTGYFATGHAGIIEATNGVNGLQTCGVVGMSTWTNTETQAVMQAYSATNGHYASWID